VCLRGRTEAHGTGAQATSGLRAQHPSHESHFCGAVRGGRVQSQAESLVCSERARAK
jgi:hypothetical protein